MERLTQYTSDGVAESYIGEADNINIYKGGMDGKWYFGTAIERLAEYEDTGLMPKEIKKLKLKQSRFKIGDTVYVLIQDIIYKGIVTVVTQLAQTTVTGTHNKIDYAVDLDNDWAYIAKDDGDIFKTKEEAEKQKIKNQIKQTKKEIKNEQS